VRFFYDCEFIEDGRTIDLISIGIVSEDGREYYAVNSKAGRGKLRDRILGREWLMANVVPHLPLARKPTTPAEVLATVVAGLNPRVFHLDETDPVVKPRWIIRNEVLALLGDEPELWAWYGAYDHITLMQLFGAMADKPAGLPMWTNDLKQECHRLGIDESELPAPTGRQHNALGDARWLREAWQWLRERESGRG
jgi:hypothetical protein